MSTSTLRLQLTKPAGADSMALGATQMSDAWSKVDAAMGVKKVANEGAATALFDGDLIFDQSVNISKLYKTPSFLKIWNDSDSKGSPQDMPVNGAAIEKKPSDGEFTVQTWLVNVVAGRKYLVNCNLNLSTDDLFGIGSPVPQGYVRMNFKWTTDVNGVPSTFIHDAASYVSDVNSSKSKNFKAFFEFFPNVTQQVKIGMSALIASGDYTIKFNSLANSTPGLYLQDWGI